MYWRRPVFGAPSLFMRKISMCICRAWICRQTPQLVRSGPRMLRVFLGGTLGNVRSSKKVISKVPWTSRSLQMDNNLSSLADHSHKVSPTTIHAIHAATSPEMPYKRNPMEVPQSLYCGILTDCSAVVMCDGFEQMGAKNFGIRSYSVILVGIMVSGHVTRRFSASLTVQVTHCRAVNFAIVSNDCHRHPREAPHPPST